MESEAHVSALALSDDSDEGTEDALSSPQTPLQTLRGADAGDTASGRLVENSALNGALLQGEWHTSEARCLQSTLIESDELT